jgi:hypothetical protein
MATRTERRYAPELNQQGDGQDRYEELRQRYEFLRANAEDVVRENKALRNQGGGAVRSTAGVFLILIAFITVGRLALYQFVQDGGNAADTVGLISNALFGAGSLLLLFVWIRAEWAEIAWLAIPKYVFVFVALLIAGNLFSDGALLRGDMKAPATHPILAGLIAITALLLAASPLAVLAVRWVLHFLQNLFGNGGE